MLAPGKAGLLRIYTDERAKGDDGPLATSVVEKARTTGIAGATVLRATVGFGQSRNVQRASILDLSGNLPIVIEIVDEISTLRRFMADLEGVEDVGLVTLEEIEVLHYGGATPVRRKAS